MARQAARQVAATVGANLRAARGSMTQREVAAKLDVPSVYVSRWERGEVTPGPMNLQKLAALFFDGDVSALYREPTKAAA